MKRKKFTPKRKNRITYQDDSGLDLNIVDEPEKQSHYRRKKNNQEIQETSKENLDYDAMTKAVVIEVSRKTAKVLMGDTIYDTIIGGQFLNRKESIIATGDHVLMEQIKTQDWVIRRVLPRRTKLSRPAAQGSQLSQVREKVIAANIDVICIVVSTTMPANGCTNKVQLSATLLFSYA
jgi:putative ribosome biogenesis GTPase RsgA